MKNEQLKLNDKMNIAQQLIEVLNEIQNNGKAIVGTKINLLFLLLLYV